MEKNIPAIIMLIAGVTASICCLANGASLLQTLEIVLIVLIVFFIIGKIASAVLVKITKQAEAAATKLAEEEAKLAEAKLAEEAAAEEEGEPENPEE